MFERSRWSAIIVLLSATNSVWAVESPPSTMIVVGRINPSSKIFPKADDVILAKLPDGSLAGEGVVTGESNYFISMSKPTNFNGTKLTLQYKQATGGAVYQLIDGNNPFSFSASGLIPSQLTINPTIGALVSKDAGTGGGTDTGGGNTGSGGGTNTGGSTGSGGNTGSTSTAKKFDVNGDGKSDHLDIEAIKQDMAHGKSSGSSDINGDGIVNTRDIIDAIKMFKGLI